MQTFPRPPLRLEIVFAIRLHENCDQLCDMDDFLETIGIVPKVCLSSRLS